MAFSAIPIYLDWAFPMNSFWIFWLNTLGACVYWPHGAGRRGGAEVLFGAFLFRVTPFNIMVSENGVGGRY